MNFDTSTLEQAMDSIISNLELLDTHMDTIKKNIQQTLIVQRKVNDVINQISAERKKISPNKDFIDSLFVQEKMLNLQLTKLSSLNTKLSDVMETIYVFINAHHKQTNIKQKFISGEINIAVDPFKLNTHESLSKIRHLLADYLMQITDIELIEFINSTFKQSGYKRFYLENNVIKSMYISDLKVVLNELLDNKNFSKLISVVNSTLGKQDQLKPIQILQAIITYHNKRKI